MNKVLLVLCLMFGSSAFAQHSWVYLNGTCSDDISEKPVVCSEYVSILESFDIEVIGTSNWLNAVCVQGNPQNLKALSFVNRIEKLGHYKTVKNQTTQTNEVFSYGNSDWQLDMLGLDSFHRLGYTGKDVTIALFDGGFYKADTVYAFDSLWQQGRIKGYWDFITNDTSLFWEYDGHGKYVLSIVGANWPDSMMGSAPGANFLLARTEDVASEKRLEEFAWVKAMEWAEENGADIIHSSLGYSVFDSLEGDYTYADMDGESTLITRATTLAFEKGIFVTNSAGNEGDDDWHYITAPCDGKHVLCVGAVDSNQKHAPFSSYGPSADGRVKPDVVAMGKGVTYINNQATLRTGGGTSFSGPLIAGFVACLKQAWPTMTNQQIYEAVIQSADRYTNPDTAYGYGLPNILKADSLLRTVVGVQEISKASGINVYPNPAAGMLKIHSEHQIVHYEVITMDGKVVLSEDLLGTNQVQLDVSPIESSLMVLMIRLKNGQSIYHKVVIAMD